MKLKYFIYIAIAGVIAYLIYTQMNSGKSDPANTPPKGMGEMRVNGIIVKSQAFTNALTISGSVEANEQIQIRTEIPGIIENIFFTEGTTINKGDLIIQLNDDELQARLQQALTQQKLAEENEGRAKQLLAKQAISQQEYDAILADLHSLQANTQLTRAQLSKTAIRAPFSGRIGLRNVSIGEYITSNMIIANLVDADPVKISFSIPEKYNHQVNKNNRIRFAIDGSKDTFQAKVYAIEPAIDIRTRTLSLKALADNKEGRLLPGTFAKIELPLTVIEDAILIPTEAIIPILNGKKVFIVRNGIAQGVEVETGTRTNESILINKGVSVGDTVLITGIMSLREGSPVKVTINQ